MDMDKYIGRLLDNRYEILEVIGSGGMAVVYKALCHRLNRPVAIKILKDENLQDADFRRRFHAESQAVAMLSHPNIVSVYDVSATDEADYIVMELVDGITLKQYMERKGLLNWKETLHFAIQIAKALEHAHSRGLVHRDIKPHNVMVLKNGSVKVTDFGIAQMMTNPNTLTKEALGSVHYISPEQAKGGRVDHRSDLYSLGVAMYEMVAGRPPYDGETPVSVALQHIQGGAPRPSQFNPNIPAGLEQIILKAMAHDVQERYASATAMLYDMDQLRKTPVVPPIETEQPDASQQKAGHVPAGTKKRPEKQKKKNPPKENSKTLLPDQELEERRNSRVTAIAIIACVLAAVIAIVIFLVITIGGSPAAPQKVQVPGLVGQYFDKLPEYPGLVIRWGSEEYNNKFEKGQIVRQDIQGGEYVNEGTVVYVVVSLGEAPPAATMENLVDMGFEKAKEYLDSLNIGLYILPREEHSETHAIGKVVRTSPAAGEPLRQGQTVTLWVSLGKEITKEPMPNLLSGGGLDRETAEQILAKNGFAKVRWEGVESDKKPGTVLSQSIPAYTMTDVSTEIIVEYSIGRVTAPTTPPADENTIQYTFQLPVMQDVFTLRIESEGRTILQDTWVIADAGSITMDLKGSGVHFYTLYINGEFYKTVTVDFEANE